MSDRAVVIINIAKRKFKEDADIPLDITADELFVALNRAYNLGIDTNNIMDCYLKAENPIAFLRGNKTLREFGIRNGSVINISE